MRDPWNDSVLARRFQAQSRTALPRAPLNSALCAIIGGDPRLFGLLRHAPDSQQQPVLLLAAIHFALLGETAHPLAAWYPNLTDESKSPSDPMLRPTLERFVSDRESAIVDLVASRRTQTNEVGRCAVLLPAFDLVAREVGALAHLDVGSSAGLTTLLPEFRYRYDDHPIIGDQADTDDELVISCSTRGDSPVDLTALTIPPVSARCGIDIHPIDITDPIEARWLEACCWPDQGDRFRRLRSAIAIARHHPPELLAGDAVDALAPTVERLGGRGHPIVTTSWMLNYLTPEHRRDFVDRLDEIGSAIDLSWVIAEAPARTPELPHAADQGGEQRTALTLVTWRGGERQVRHLATCHPHGYWIHWR